MTTRHISRSSRLPVAATLVAIAALALGFTLRAVSTPQGISSVAFYPVTQNAVAYVLDGTVTESSVEQEASAERRVLTLRVDDVILDGSQDSNRSLDADDAAAVSRPDVAAGDELRVFLAYGNPPLDYGPPPGAAVRAWVNLSPNPDLVSERGTPFVFVAAASDDEFFDDPANTQLWEDLAEATELESRELLLSLARDVDLVAAGGDSTHLLETTADLAASIFSAEDHETVAALAWEREPAWSRGFQEGSAPDEVLAGTHLQPIIWEIAPEVQELAEPLVLGLRPPAETFQRS